MKRRIKRIAPLQAGKMLGALYACMGLIFLPFFALAAMAGAFVPSSQQSDGGPPPALFAGMMFGFAIFTPIIYGVMGFVGGIIAAALTTFSRVGLAASRSKSNSLAPPKSMMGEQIVEEIKRIAAANG